VNLSPSCEILAGARRNLVPRSPIPIVNARERGIPFGIIAPSAVFRSDKPTNLLVVAASSPIRTPRDLEGKTIALVELRGIMEASVRAWMTQNHADPSNVHFIEMGFPVMAAVLTAHRVDAAFLVEPMLTVAGNAVRVIGSPFASLGPSWYQNVWFVNTDWEAKNPALAHRFADAIEKAARWANGHQSETAQMLLKHSKLTEDVVHKDGARGLRREARNWEASADAGLVGQIRSHREADGRDVDDCSRILMRRCESP
jgi:NitT/TauT family transport system substrate-binding protein